MNKKILIITNTDDLHADLITAILKEKDSTPFRINLDSFPRDYQLYQEYSKGKWTGSIKHIPSQDELLLANVGAVWLRKTAEFEFMSNELGLQEKAYAKAETEHTLQSLLFSLDCYWMSHPLAVRSSQWKGEQLQRAAKLGFHIPASIISNCTESVKKFKQSIDDDMIFKSMSTPILAANEVEEIDCVTFGLGTTLVTDDDMEDLDAVAELPCHFQQHIPKQYELRITVIGDKVFAVKIDSQQDDRTKLDFRNFSIDIPYSAVELPDEITNRCREFVQSYQLNFGAIDIIVTPDNEYVFLENNPCGQFLFVEQLVPELKMMDAIADCLIAGARC